MELLEFLYIASECVNGTTFLENFLAVSTKVKHYTYLLPIKLNIIPTYDSAIPLGHTRKLRLEIKKKKKDLFKNKTPFSLHQKAEIIQIFINKRMDKT